MIHLGHVSICPAEVAGHLIITCSCSNVTITHTCILLVPHYLCINVSALIVFPSLVMVAVSAVWHLPDSQCRPDSGRRPEFRASSWFPASSFPPVLPAPDSSLLPSLHLRPLMFLPNKARLFTSMMSHLINCNYKFIFINFIIVNSGLIYNM